MSSYNNQNPTNPTNPRLTTSAWQPAPVSSGGGQSIPTSQPPQTKPATAAGGGRGGGGGQQQQPPPHHPNQHPQQNPQQGYQQNYQQQQRQQYPYSYTPNYAAQSNSYHATGNMQSATPQHAPQQSGQAQQGGTTQQTPQGQVPQQSQIPMNPYYHHPSNYPPQYLQAPPPHYNPYNPYYPSQPQSLYPAASPQQPRQTPTYQPPPRERRALVITDKFGNPIDLGSVKKVESKASPSLASVATPGNKLREAALARMSQTSDPTKKSDDNTSGSSSQEISNESKEVPGEKKSTEANNEASKQKLAGEKAAAEEAEKKKLAEEAAKKKLAEEQEAIAAAENEAKNKKVLEEQVAAATAETQKAVETIPETEVRSVEEVNIVVSTPSATSKNGKRRVYSKEDLLRFKELKICCCRPSGLPDMTIEKGQPRGAGGTNNRGAVANTSWSRGQATPNNRRQSSGNLAPSQTNGQWTRGQAPPPQVKTNAGPNNKGGRGGNNAMEPSFDFKPLVQSDNRWRPKKNANSLIVAEKMVKSILNKMTKEKYERLSKQMCEIPLESHATLNMMIRLIYQKAIDEPTFGDLYAELCVLLCETVQTSSYVHLIESDEESENGSNVVWRWSNDVSHTDDEVVGPFSKPTEAEEAALSTTATSEPVPRGDMTLEIWKLKIVKGMFIKILKKVKPPEEKAVTDDDEDSDDESNEEYYVVFFPIDQATECGQPMSDLFLSERECRSDASKNNSFKRTLLNQCQDEFNKQDIFEDWKKERALYESQKDKLTEAEQREKEEEFEFRKIKIKKQMLGNIKFIGQLYKKSLIKEKIMRYCIGSLLKLNNVKQGKLPEYEDTGETDLDEDDHDALCSMFTTIGATIDTPIAKEFMKLCFTKMAKFIDEKSFSSRVRFMYKDLIDLRENGWVPRRKEEKAKTLDEIRKDVELEERMQEQARATNNFGNNNNNMRNSNRNLGYNNNNRQSNMTRNNDSRRSVNDANNNRRPGKPQTTTDEDGFSIVLNPGGNPRTGGTPTLRGNSNMGRDSQRRILQKPPTSAPAPPVVSSSIRKATVTPNPTATAAAVPPAPTPTPTAPTPAPLDTDKLALRVKNIRAEYLQDPSNVTELLLSMDELSGTPGAYIAFVQHLADRILDCSDHEFQSIVELIVLLYEKKSISSTDVQTGLADMIEFIDSFSIDLPTIFEKTGTLVSSCLNIGAVDIGWLVDNTEKAKVMDKPLLPQRVVKEVMVSYVSKFGEEKAKDLFSTGTAKFSSLLGQDEWNVLFSSIFT